MSEILKKWMITDKSTYFAGKKRIFRQVGMDDSTEF